MVNISISEKIKFLCPKLRLGCIEANVVVSDSDESLSLAISNHIARINQKLFIDDISRLPVISSSRQAYKACGKDPARYRLSAEALLRRVVSGKGLYKISNVVDQLNLVSISSGFSIGGYDADQIQGDVVFGIGSGNEPYQGIGRGELNIEGLPVFRDNQGAFGTPTSDSQRTEVTRNTVRFLMVLVDFGSDPTLDATIKMAIGLLKDHCFADILWINFIE